MKKKNTKEIDATIENTELFEAFLKNIETNRRVLEFQQNSEEWDLARVGKITGSEIVNLIGTPAARKKFIYKKAAEFLTQRKCDADSNTFANVHIKRGNYYEDVARSMYSSIKGVQVRTVGFIDIEGDILGCSPDGFVEDVGMIEIKCPDTNNFVEVVCEVDEKRHLAIQKEYYAQMQYNMLISGKEWCDFITYSPYFAEEGQQIFIERVPLFDFDKKYLFDVISSAKEEIANVAAKFLEIQYKRAA